MHWLAVLSGRDRGTTVISYLDDERFAPILASEPATSTRRVAALRLTTGGQLDDRLPPGPTQELLAGEDCVTLTVQDMGSFTFLCTPNDTLALAVGFALTEGLIEHVDDVLEVTRAPDDPLQIAMRIDKAGESSARRNLIITGACGLCGTRNVESLLSGLHPVPDTLRISPERLPAMASALRHEQSLFSSTGGTHAAALFSADGQRLAQAEDVGRHTALDKALGQLMLAGGSPSGCAAMLSGRVSYELVAKAARAGIELIAAVSAPSSLALQAAEAAGITLVAFVRRTRATVYAGGQRIVQSSSSA